MYRTNTGQNEHVLGINIQSSLQHVINSSPEFFSISSKSIIPGPVVTNMKTFIALALFVTTIVSAVSYGNSRLSTHSYDSQQVVKKPPPVITSYSQTIRGSLENDLKYTTADGDAVAEHTQTVNRPSSYIDEHGRLVQSDKTVVKSGSYSFTDVGGEIRTVHYVADEHGYRATGDHLPGAVSKTPEVLKAEAEHLALFREVEAKMPLDKYSHSQYEAPAVRSSSYSAPAPVEIRSSSYHAPAHMEIRTQSYAAPAVRTSSY